MSAKTRAAIAFAVALAACGRGGASFSPTDPARGFAGDTAPLDDGGTADAGPDGGTVPDAGPQPSSASSEFGGNAHGCGPASGTVPPSGPASAVPPSSRGAVSPAKPRAGSVGEKLAPPLPQAARATAKAIAARVLAVISASGLTYLGGSRSEERKARITSSRLFSLISSSAKSVGRSSCGASTGRESSAKMFCGRAAAGRAPARAAGRTTGDEVGVIFGGGPCGGLT